MQFPNAAAFRRAASYVVLLVCTTGCAGEATRVTPPSCTFSLSPASASHAASGGTGSVTVTTAANCSWAATSDVDWVKVTAGSSGRGSGSLSYSVAPNPTGSVRHAAISVVDDSGRGTAALHQVAQQGTTGDPTRLPVRGAYIFWIHADPACGWPLSAFYWPVSVAVTSYADGTTVGSVVFPPASLPGSNTWSIQASPTSTQLMPAPGSPGPVAAAYNLVVEGGRWEAGGPTPARDGRGEIPSGIATGTRLILRLPGSDTRWECRSDATWSLLARYVDSTGRR